jgi:ubiquinone/menaquinone biosynthesis C-methylase UbiE
MTQNIYDDPDFFVAYSRLPRSVQGLAAAPEWPVLRAWLPALTGKRVLDLGCGYGWFSRWARAQGAARVLGIDVSQRMLERAHAHAGDPGIEYVRADLQAYDYPAAQFEVAYSSLALHYLEQLERVLHGVQRALVADGSFVFSVEHPLFTAPKHPGFIDHPTDGHRSWPVDGYLDEGPRTTAWLAPGVIKQHRTLASYIRLLHAAGFRLEQLAEWAPRAAHIAEHPDWRDERERPAFLLVACRRG